MAGERIWLPPDWTDRGAPANAVSEAQVTVKLVPLTQRAAAR
jgi:hypothetical protein